MSSEPFGIYVHVPYCRAVCPYCDFNVHVRKSPPWDALFEAYRTELHARGSVFSGRPVRSLYFGGGTPSLAPPECIGTLIRYLRQRAPLQDGAEITLEVDPGTAGVDALRRLREQGVNRLSLGWQSTHGSLLKVLGRSHDAEASALTLRNARRVGFQNLSLDIIFGVPGQNVDHVRRDVEALVATGVPHVSLYALTYHEGTVFERRRRSGALQPVDDDSEAEMMDVIATTLVAAGYRHYEVSNFAQPGYEAVHNQGYWYGRDCLGLGPGAHSFLGLTDGTGVRWEGVRDPDAYLRAWDNPASAARIPVSGDAATSWVEHLSAEQCLLERLICGFRLDVGVSLEALPASFLDAYATSLAEAQRRQWLQVRRDALVPTPLGRRFADGLAELFVGEHRPDHR